MQGKPMIDYAPLHLDPLEREPRLKPWLDSVMKGLKPEFLTPEGWFDEGQGYGTYVWTAAPAAGEVVVEQLGRARLKRPESSDVCDGDRELMGDFWRALLDAFWSREPPTVRGNLDEAVRGERYGDRTGMPSVTPPMGPFPLEDTSGMKVAVSVLD
jgi:hypothetical protein